VVFILHFVCSHLVSEGILAQMFVIYPFVCLSFVNVAGVCCATAERISPNFKRERTRSN
jgi:hypothetical protein